MTDQQQQLVSRAQAAATDIILNKVSKRVVYHNLDHTKDVVKACTQIGDHYRINDEDRAALLTAAWFHDTGFSSGYSEGHEDAGILLAEEFLNVQEAGEAFTEKTINIIAATKVPTNPVGLLQQIICDADSFHLGTDDFKKTNQLLRKEMNDFWGKNISKKEWRKINIDFIEHHQYFTDYCSTKLEPVKQQHLQELKKKNADGVIEIPEKKQEKPEAVAAPVVNTIPDKKQAEKLVKKIKKEKTDSYGRGVETMFRTTSANHLRLSDMADGKANILIQVNSIIISIIISVLFSKLEKNTQFIIPSIVLISVSIASIIFAILATRPNVTSGTFSKEDIINKKTNLLFFGNFHKVSLSEYEWGMKEMMKDNDYLYGSMTKDIYFLGVVLARKYRYLRTAYNIFMYGLVIAVLAFAIAMLFGTEQQVMSASVQ
jgi:predicted metal-dependent HD superfamily phosphohydrolase